MSREYVENQQEQLPLEGFPEARISIPAKLRLIAAGKLVWDYLRHPLIGSTLIMDAEADEIRVVHWNNPEEMVQEKNEKV